MTQNAGITPENLLDAVRQCHHEFPGVLGITDPSDNDGVIIYMPAYSWYFGIHGENPEWDGNGYLDGNLHRTGIERHGNDGARDLYLDEYIGMGVAIDSKGWNLDQMVTKIVQVIRDRELTDGNECMSGPDGIHACYANGNECHCPCVHCDSEAI